MFVLIPYPDASARAMLMRRPSARISICITVLHNGRAVPNLNQTYCSTYDDHLKAWFIFIASCCEFLTSGADRIFFYLLADQIYQTYNKYWHARLSTSAVEQKYILLRNPFKCRAKEKSWQGKLNLLPGKVARESCQGKLPGTCRQELSWGYWNEFRNTSTKKPLLNIW